MNFSTSSRVLATIRAGDTAEWERGSNRVKINNAANCAPPVDAETAKRIGLKINVNWGELMTLLSQARRIYRTAFFSSLNFFQVKIPKAPSDYQSEWESFITAEINKNLRRSLKYFELHESRWASVVCHGIGPMCWYDPYSWCPEYVAIEDLRIPTDTTLDHQNLDWWAVRKPYTPMELWKAVFGRSGSTWNKSAGARVFKDYWDKNGIADILRNYKNINYDYAPNAYDWETTPEKFAELFKQDGGWFTSDAMPAIPLWHFYFLDNTIPREEGIYMCIVPDTGAIRGTPPDDFLYRSKDPIAKKRERVLHCQYGDLSNKAPFLHHSVRSLGFALMEPTFYSNLTKCRMLQHIHDNFNIWLRSNDPVDKARAQVQEFGNLGIVRPGLEIMTQDKRHQIDGNLLEFGMAQLKQLQQEASAAYTQSTDTGTKREQTAFETSVKVQQVNAMMSGLLLKAFKYETYAYREICRRHCLFDSDDDDVKEFQKSCEEANIPRKWLDVRLWEIEPVTPLGMGNPTVAQAAAQQLLGILPLLDPTAQQEAKHEIVLTITGDPRKAARWAPLGKGRGITDAQRDAQLAFGTLMQGVPIAPREGLSAIDQFEAMLPLLAGKVVACEKKGVASADEAAGLQEVSMYLEKLVQQLAQNPQEKQRVKQYGDTLGKLNNQIKALVQRGQEQAQQGNGNGGLSPEQEAKIHAIMATTAAKVHAGQVKDQTKAKQNQEKFVREERRKDASAFAEIQRGNIKAKADAATRMKAFQE